MVVALGRGVRYPVRLSVVKKDELDVVREFALCSFRIPFVTVVIIDNF